MLLGRDDELSQLDVAVASALAGEGRMVLIAGEPGVGKTRLAATASARAEGAGFRVVWGRCREEGGTPAHWPWVQILRALVQEAEPDRLAAAVGRGRAYLSAAVPQIGDRLPASSRAAGEAAAPTRFAFFDAVETFLRTLADSTPLALILDDLHAADPSSLALFDFIAPEVRRARMVLIVTYREHEASKTEAGPVIARAVRHGERIRLMGLGYDDIEALSAETAGHAVPPRLVAAVQRATEGNPLFVQEMVRTLAATGRLGEGEEPRYLELADSVQHVIATRLEPLSAAARDVLSAAAVAGRTFDVATLEAATDVSAYEILTHLQSAADAGIATLSGGVRGDASFSHALYREFFYTGLPASRRAVLHAQLAAALERQNTDTNLPDIAFHLLEAGPVGNTARAAEFARRAGDQASARFGYAQAVKHYEDALRALETTAGSSEDRCDLLTCLGDAYFRAGDGEASKSAFRKAANVARALGDGTRLARAALGLGGPWAINGGVAREEVVRDLEDALRYLGEGQAALRTILLARLAVEFYIDGTQRGLKFSEEAVVLGRQAGDPRALAEAVLARLTAIGGIATLEERLSLAREAVELAGKAGDDELTFRGRFVMVNMLLEAGHRVAFDREMGVAARLADRLRLPFYKWFVAAWRAAVALVDGRLDEAEGLIEHAFATGCEVQGQDEIGQFAVPVCQVQLYNLRLEQGRGLADIEPAWRAMVESIAMPVMHCGLMCLHSAMQRWTEARDAFERFAVDDFAALPTDWTLIPCLAFAAETCADLGERERAGALYDRALPYAAHHISNGSYYYGSMSHHLGRLAATMDRRDEAAEHFRTALKVQRRMGARCWVTRTQYHYGDMLLHSEERRERQRGRAMLHEALERARQLGMLGLTTAIERRLAELTERRGDQRAHSLSPTQALGAGADEQALFRKDGDYWTIEFGGVACRLKDARGLSYIEQLLRHPEREFHAAELVTVAGGFALDVTSVADAAKVADQQIAPDLGNAGLALDRQAAAEYRERLADLRAEIEEAERFSDLGRVSRAREELDFLTAELAAAGRGGKLGSHAERARQAVTKGIKNALDRMALAHPMLAKHLRATIKRGYFCSYVPDPRHPITWKTALVLCASWSMSAADFLELLA